MKIVMLVGGDISTKFIYNGITPNIEIEKILLVDSSSKIKMIKRRIKRLGLLKVINQLLFQTVIVYILNIISRGLKKKRIVELHLNNKELPQNKIVKVGSINSDLLINTLIDINPDVVIVNGTSIIPDKVLKCIKSIFINTHSGITPQYRGVHGGYWALRNNDSENFGVTIHKLDSGIDTGDIICQDTVSVKPDDNFVTYPLCQTALAIPLLIETINKLKTNQLNLYRKENVISKLYYHPTFSDYIFGLLKQGVK